MRTPDEVTVTLGLGCSGSKSLPLLGEEAGDASVEPVDLGAAAHRHSRDDDPRDPIRMSLGVREDER